MHCCLPPHVRKAQTHTGTSGEITYIILTGYEVEAQVIVRLYLHIQILARKGRYS